MTKRLFYLAVGWRPDGNSGEILMTLIRSSKSMQQVVTQAFDWSNNNKTDYIWLLSWNPVTGAVTFAGTEPIASIHLKGENAVDKCSEWLEETVMQCLGTHFGIEKTTPSGPPELN